MLEARTRLSIRRLQDSPVIRVWLYWGSTAVLALMYLETGQELDLRGFGF